MTQNTEALVTRKAAQAAGLTHYFTGKPCKRGHIAARFVSQRTCVDCVNENTKQWKSENRERVNSLRRAAYEADIEHQRARSLKWHEENRERSCARMLDRQRSMPEIYAQKHKEWAQANKGKVCAITARRNAAKLQRTPVWADLEAIRRIYENCPPGHHVDHVIPLQGRRVSGLHVHNNLQYLPARDNISKNNKFDPDTFVP